MDPSKPVRVYLVDDDASVRRAVSRLLHAAGIHAREFGSVDEFMQYDIEPRRACVVAEARMSSGGGIDLPRQLREIGCSIPVILTSADDPGCILAAAKIAGAAGFFRKPVDGQALIDAVNWALGDPPAAKVGGQAARKEIV